MTEAPPTPARACAYCASPLAPDASAARLYCSDRCAGRAYRARTDRGAPAPTETRTCPICGTAFEVISQGRGRLYCSDACGARAQHLRDRKPPPEPVTATCLQCGQLFQYVPRGEPRRFCTPKCKYLHYNHECRQPPDEPEHPPDPGISWPPTGIIRGTLRCLTDPPSRCCRCGRDRGPDEPINDWRVRLYPFRTRAGVELVPDKQGYQRY